MAHVKLHIPGPIEVSDKTLRAFRSPMIGHRGQGFKDLCAKIQPQLQQLLYTKQLVYLSTSSAWGVMEGAIRNLVSKKVLNCMCGAFSDKWLDVSKRCGKDAEALQVPWGSPIRAEQVDARLDERQEVRSQRGLAALEDRLEQLRLEHVGMSYFPALLQFVGYVHEALGFIQRTLRIHGMPLRIYRGIIARNHRGGQAAFHDVPFCR